MFHIRPFQKEIAADATQCTSVILFVYFSLLSLILMACQTMALTLFGLSSKSVFREKVNVSVL